MSAKDAAYLLKPEPSLYASQLNFRNRGIIPCGPEPLSHVDMSEFYRLVDFIDNDPAQLSMERYALQRRTIVFS
jgi:hypothetical protein